MAKQHLNDPQISARFEHVRCEAMANHVRRDSPRYPSLRAREPQCRARDLRAQMSSTCGRKEPRARRTHELPVRAKRVEQSRPQGDQSFTAALAVADVNDSARRVDIASLESACLNKSKASRVHQGEKYSILGFPEGLKQTLYFAPADHYGQPLGVFGPRKERRYFGTAERTRVKELQRREVLRLRCALRPRAVRCCIGDGFGIASTARLAH